MQYAYIKLIKNKKSLFRHTEHTVSTAGNNSLHIINSSEKLHRLEKKLIRTGIDSYLSTEEFPRLKRYSPQSFYKYFAPVVFGYMYKNYPSDKLTICSDNPDDIIYLVCRLSHVRMSFCAVNPSEDTVNRVLELTGIPLLATNRPDNCILIRFSGDVHSCGGNVHTADFRQNRFIFEGFPDNIDFACMYAEYMNVNKENLSRDFHLLKIV